MSTGKTMTTPEFLQDDIADTTEATYPETMTESNDFSMKNLVEKTCDLLENKSLLEKSKIMKVFNVGDKHQLGIYQTGIKKEAELQGKAFMKIPLPKKYPVNVKTGIQLFTKPGATVMTG